MKILITGSRLWTDGHAIKSAILEHATPDLQDTAVIHGSALGADSLAQLACNELGIFQQRHPVTKADVRELGKRAYYLRNKNMVDNGADICLAFIKGQSKGTRMTMRLADEAGIPVVMYEEE